MWGYEYHFRNLQRRPTAMMVARATSSHSPTFLITNGIVVVVSAPIVVEKLGKWSYKWTAHDRPMVSTLAAERYSGVLNDKR